ncbi:glycosyltransferase family 2 protein [Priestia endophytica]|uniref:glycosyltransferase family 2 protein n=1 Tax=Priestia endophytica TaxID=135735 RepID=UPI000DCA8BE2|nr:glycosyltransferase family 2 protein [Priestia endophytica]RAS82896.1 glycosyl transferase [Priestia endophytica]
MKLSIIIPACDEGETIANVIKEAKGLNPFEIIVVVNGSTDNTGEIARNLNCRVISFEEKLGIDVGRAVGAKEAKGDILLFLDGDIPMHHTKLRPFVQAIQSGQDIALNNLSWTLYRKVRPHFVAVWKLALNFMLKREDLHVNSLVAIPHAMSKKAAEGIGYKNLAVPPLAQTIAVLSGMKISAPAAVDVVTTNKIKTTHRTLIDGLPSSTNLIIGDHMEAISYLLNEKGKRGGLTDGPRKRTVLDHYGKFARTWRKKIKYSAVIPVGEEKETIMGVIEEVRKAGVEEIIVIGNGADRETIKKARSMGAIVLDFPYSLGHNVPRAIGAMHSNGEVCLFVDGDIVIKAEDLRPFLEAGAKGVHVAVNDLDSFLDRFHPIHCISAAKQALMLAAKRQDLSINTMTAIPHAIRREVFEKIGYETLIVPPLAQVLAIEHGFIVKAVHEVDVITTNRIRKDHKKVNNNLASSTERILGDHAEALHHLIQKTDKRGGFTDGGRNREVLERLDNK